MIKKIHKLLNRIAYLDLLYEKCSNDTKIPKINLGQIQAELNTKKKDITNLSDVEFQVFSQFGDDGIIQWLIGNLPIPHKTFIEFGVENYKESNTRFLLISNYWSGLVIDGDEQNIKSIRNQSIINFYDILPIQAFINKDNINQLINQARFNPEVGILSIDIDGNDYWVWKEINCINPIIVISEYNSLFGFNHPYTIEYKTDFVRGKSLPFNFYGSSLLSLYNLSKDKGYTFIGCNSAGNNAYFIRNDFVKYLNIKETKLEQGYRFSIFSECWDANGIALRGTDKIKTIDNLPVFNTVTHQVERVNSNEIIDSLKKYNKINRL
jgi:hypothetical protein